MCFRICRYVYSYVDFHISWMFTWHIQAWISKLELYACMCIYMCAFKNVHLAYSGLDIETWAVCMYVYLYVCVQKRMHVRAFICMHSKMFTWQIEAGISGPSGRSLRAGHAPDEHKQSDLSHVTNKESLQEIMKKKDKRLGACHSKQRVRRKPCHEQRVVSSHYEEERFGACHSKQRVRCKPWHETKSSPK